MNQSLAEAVASIPPAWPALVWRDRAISYETLVGETSTLKRALANSGVKPGTVASIEGDFTPRTLSALLALLELRAIVVPLATEIEERAVLCERAEVEIRVTVENEELRVEKQGTYTAHELYTRLRTRGHPGLVLFSSGSDGPPKAAVHDFLQLTRHVRRSGRSSRICAFLVFDHIGGLNTLLYSLTNGGCLVVPQERTPDEVCEAIEAHRVEVLPTTPTFLNLMLLSGAVERFDLGSLTLITFGTEVMPAATLTRVQARLPSVRLLQTYGLSETGILATRSPDERSVWFKISAEQVRTRVVNGKLHVHAPSTMLGYLEGPSAKMLPGGWFDTGDLVECSGDLIRVLGRADDLINVGGLKVHPVEVEAAALEVDGVLEARASGEHNTITGQHVRLEVVLSTDEAAPEFRRRLREYLAERLEPYKIPQRVVVCESKLHSRRHKTIRNHGADPAPARRHPTANQHIAPSQ